MFYAIFLFKLRTISGIINIELVTIILINYIVCIGLANKEVVHTR